MKTFDKVVNRIMSGIAHKTFIKCVECDCVNSTPYVRQDAENKFKEWGWDIEERICPWCRE